jgi:two-component system cell cycle response regulator CpdR
MRIDCSAWPALPAELKMSVLIVEDEVLIGDELRETLITNGFEVRTVRRGQEAIDELTSKAVNYRAAVIDIRLADGVSGWDVGRIARANFPHVPIVYISAIDSIDWPTHGVSNSIMMSKPLDVSRLMVALNALLENKVPNAHSDHGPADAALNALEISRNREQFVRALSDEDLVRYFSLLSDSRVVANVPSLQVLEAEIVRRQLPIGKQH